MEFFNILKLFYFFSERSEKFAQKKKKKNLFMCVCIFLCPNEKYRDINAIKKTIIHLKMNCNIINTYHISIFLEMHVYYPRIYSHNRVNIS